MVLLLGLLLRIPGIAAIVVTVTVAVAFIRWKTTKLVVADGYLYINKGVIVNKRVRVKIPAISAVTATRSVIDIIAGSVSVAFFTEAGAVCGKRGIRIFAKSQVQLCSLLGFAKGQIERKSTFLQTLLHALSTTSVFTGALITIPVIKKIDGLLAENESSIDKIGEFGKELFGLPPLVNLAVTFYLIVLGISLLLFIIRQMGRRNYCGGETAAFAFGILPRRTVFVRKSGINGVFSEQTPILQFLGKQFLKADVAGVNYKKRYEFYLSPPESNSCWEFLGVPTSTEKNSTKYKRAEKWRYFTVPFCYASVITIFLLAANVTFPWLTDLIIVLVATLFVVLSHRFYLAKYAYRHVNIDLYSGKAHFIRGANVLLARFHPERVGIILLTTFPYDRKTEVCTVNVALRSEQGTKIKVKYAPRGEIEEQLKNLRVK